MFDSCQYNNDSFTWKIIWLILHNISVSLLLSVQTAMWWWALICIGHAGTVCTGLTGLNIVPIKYSSYIHTPKHNYHVINIADITVTLWHRNFYLVTVFEYIKTAVFAPKKCL